MTPKLNIIGGGKLGRTLGHLWYREKALTIGDVLCTRMPSAYQAVEFIGAGKAVEVIDSLTPAKLWLIATPDRLIRQISADLANSDTLSEGDIAFHCSGALPSSELASLRQKGVHVASIHPVHSFADPLQSITQFKGTFCSYEGDPQALDTLLPLFETLNANLLAINSNAKSLYHTGTVMACNYLVPLIEASLQCLQAANLSRADSAQLLAPLIHATADNVLQKHATEALTGPISRGDGDTVERQWQALSQQLPEVKTIYQSLGLEALAIARKQAQADPAALAQIEQLLSGDN